jgi:3-dehydroquinate synthase
MKYSGPLAIKETVAIPARGARYQVLIGAGSVEELGVLTKNLLNPKRATVISNSDIWKVTGDAVTDSLGASDIVFDLIAIPEGESSKNLETTAIVYEAMADVRASRTEPVIAVGGGVIGDTAGFVAATYMRGVPFINVPTTFLAMTDSSIGGKTGVDLEAGKNLVGAFHQPKFVIADTRFLETLPAREMRCGLAEVIKTAFLAGGGFMDFVKENIDLILKVDDATLIETIKEAVHFKAGIVSKDPEDNTGLRAILNYGHTFGHALETSAGYKDINHGEAVAQGMVFAARLSEKLDICKPALVDETIKLLDKAGLPSQVDFESTNKLIEIMDKDKKNNCDDIRFVLIEKAGKPVLTNVARRDVISLIKELSDD